MARLEPLALALVLCVAPIAALCDCVDGVRSGTANEQAFSDRTRAALHDALPAALANWEVKRPDFKPSPVSLCAGTPEGDFSISVQAKYTYKPPKDEVERNSAEVKKLEYEIQALETLPPDVQAQRKALAEKYSEMTRAARQAEKDGNKQLASQNYNEREEYNRQSNDLRQRHLQQVKSQVDPLKEKMASLNYRPQDFILRISVNEPYSDAPASGRGVQFALGAVPAPKSPVLKVRGVRVVVEGPSPRSDELAATVDKAKLQALLR